MLNACSTHAISEPEPEPEVSNYLSRGARLTDSVRHAIEIAGGECSDEALHWLRSGLCKFLDTACEEPIEACLQLTGGNLRRFRDNCIKLAAAELKGDRDITPWVLAGELKHALNRFESLPNKYNRPALSPMNQHIFDARIVSRKQLTTRESIYNLLKD